MKIIETADLLAWYQQNGFGELNRSIGWRHPDPEYIERELGVPLHLRFVTAKMGDEADEPVGADSLDSIPFYSLCRGLFLPLSGMSPEKTASIFGIRTGPPPNSAERQQLLETFLDKNVGLTLDEKLGCILGDAFRGRRSTFRRDRLLRLLMSVEMTSRADLLDRLTRAGDVAVLYAENRSELKSDPPLTAAEVLRTLYYSPDEGINDRMDLMRSLLERCGKLEAYFLSKLLLRKAGFGFDYQGPLIARALAARYGSTEEEISHATALTDVFHVAEVLRTEGAAGLRSIQLQPLVPVRPALAGGHADDLSDFPVWVERKYDGIRFMLHKSTGGGGSVLCGAYTRNRGDWLELVPGLDATIRMIPAANVILDGELYGTVLDLERVRPAWVYEVYGALQGDVRSPVNLRFAAFDLIYLNGLDLTQRPLHERRQMLTTLLTPLTSASTPVPITIAEGQLAGNKNDVNRLYEHFRSQGYEGVIAKKPDGVYKLATRDPDWMKRKPVITLDLALVGATYAVTSKENAGVFGSYVIAARTPESGFEIVGDVAGVDRVRDAEIQQEIMREGLMTGVRIERPSSSGVRPGVELRPSIVVTVKFEGIVRHEVTGQLSLRDPKIATIRSDKSATEADSTESIRQLFLKQRVG